MAYIVTPEGKSFDENDPYSTLSVPADKDDSIRGVGAEVERVVSASGATRYSYESIRRWF